MSSLTSKQKANKILKKINAVVYKIPIKNKTKWYVKNFKMSMKLEKKHLFIFPVFMVMAYLSQELIFFGMELVK